MLRRQIGSIWIWIKKHPEILVLVFFCAVLILGIYIHRDYGMFIDDAIEKIRGEEVFNYIFQSDESYRSNPDRDHGVIFDLMLTIMIKAFNITSDPDIYFFRHLCIFLSFYFGVVIFYLLIKKTTKNWKWAALGSLFFFLSPRIFEYAFIDSKDISMLFAAILSAYTLVLFNEKPSVKTLILHSLASGLLIALRIAGIYILVITIIILGINLLGHPGRKTSLFSGLNFIGGYLLLSCLSMVLFWPTLWHDPLHEFATNFIRMSKYPSQYVILYMGQYINTHDLPWHYIPVWIAITTPLLYSFYFILGIFYISKDLIKNRLLPSWNNRNLYILILGWFFLPLFSVIILNSALYNGWRHLFFIYPAFLFISIIGVGSLNHTVQKHFNNPWIRMIIPITMIASLIGTTSTMIKYHPHQSMYYNLLAGKNMESVRYRYDMDPSGTCNREALEKILAEDKSPKVPILLTYRTGHLNAILIDPQDRSRIVYAENFSDAKYFIGDYFNSRRDPYPFDPDINPWYRISIGGVDLCVVYRLKHN